MKTFAKRQFLCCMAAGLAAAFAPAAYSQETAETWPSKPVTIVVGYTAGGPTDMIGRILAEQLSKKFNQTFIVDNKPGAGGVVAAAQLTKAKADGYTLMIGSSGTLTIAPHLAPSFPFDPLKDLTAIGLVANYPYFLVVPGSSKFNSLEELLQGAKTDHLSFASAGNGAVNHLAGEWLTSLGKMNASHIPYRGDSAAVTDLIGGRVDFAFLAGAVAIPQSQSGKLKVLASGSLTPGRGGKTISEAKFKGFSAEPWNGLMAPPGLPADIAKKINDGINEVMHKPEVVAQLAKMEQYPLTGPAADYSKMIQTESARWKQLIQSANIKAQ
ncbi:MAG: tripartite tricarboxylate transporter substrate binding protein [Comamonas sp.]|nr:tripartite tricarboxylate transporter substrate binding protein [Comamonas sp.]